MIIINVKDKKKNKFIASKTCNDDFDFQQLINELNLKKYRTPDFIDLSSEKYKFFYLTESDRIIPAEYGIFTIKTYCELDFYMHYVLFNTPENLKDINDEEEEQRLIKSITYDVVEEKLKEIEQTLEQQKKIREREVLIDNLFLLFSLSFLSLLIFLSVLYGK